MKTPIYLDHNSTTPVDPLVLEEMMPCFSEHFGNPASKAHSFGWHAEELIEIARERVAALINAEPQEIYFTNGATEANNIALKGFLCYEHERCGELPAVVTSPTEHRSVLEPVEYLKSLGANCHFLELEEDGSPKRESLFNSISKPKQTTLLSLMLANNETGVINELAFSLAEKMQGRFFFHNDATQALGRIPVDVRKLGADMLSFSSHKIYGPKGAGALFIKGTRERLPIVPLTHGGGHEGGLVAGTLNVPAIVGFGKACELAATRVEKDRKHFRTLSACFLSELDKNSVDYKINAKGSPRLENTLSMSFKDQNSNELIGALSDKVALSSSSACSSASKEMSHVLQAMGLSKGEQRSSIRISFGRGNTEREIVFAALHIAKQVNR